MGFGKLVSSSDPDKCGSASVFFLVRFVMKKGMDLFSFAFDGVVFWSSVKSIDAAFGFSRDRVACV